jgi:hypothetical protein
MEVSDLKARVDLLNQLVRMMMRELAFDAGKTPDDVLRSGEEVRQFFEANLPVGVDEMRMNGEVTAFFNLLATELRAMKGS